MKRAMHFVNRTSLGYAKPVNCECNWSTYLEKVARQKVPKTRSINTKEHLLQLQKIVI
jgi:hypothetical protein